MTSGIGVPVAPSVGLPHSAGVEDRTMPTSSPLVSLPALHMPPLGKSFISFLPPPNGEMEIYGGIYRSHFGRGGSVLTEAKSPV